MRLLIQTKKGMVEGVQGEGFAVFRGIPFAKPPVGELRWRAPQEVEPWEGVYKADHFAKICPQAVAADPNPYYREFYANPTYDREQSEDCLYLNVWVPDHAEGKKCPVAMFIHGGAFNGGYSSEIEFDGAGLARRGVILVTIAYRLGVFGFLAHPWLSAESARHVSGNYGILDQIAALNWVYDNIGAFGGDPDNITVFGQSAGCMSTQVLVSSRLSRDKIAKAIFQSGLICSSDILATPTLAEEEAYGEQIVARTGAANLEELRQMPASDLMKAKDAFDREAFAKSKNGAGGLLIVPNVDGYVLARSVKESYAAGDLPRIPTMEGVVTTDLGSTPEDGKKRVPGVLLTEAERWAEREEEIGGPASYVYWFDRTMPGDHAPAWHSMELWYTMGTLGRSWRPMEQHDYDLSEEVMNCWSSFMKTGNPEGENTESWAPYTREHPFVRHFV